MTNRLALLPVIYLVGLALPVLRAADISTNAPVATTPAVPLEPNPPATTTTAAPTPAPAESAPSAERPTTYTVVAGDTLWDLSHKFNCSIRSLKKLNKLKKDHLKPGQLLKIPAAHTTTAQPTASADAPSSGTNVASDDAASPEKPPAKKVARASKSAKSSHTDSDFAVTAKTKKHRHGGALVAQPVQDFDIPPSTFASCPAPPSNGADDPIPAPEETTPASPEAAASPRVLLTPPPAENIAAARIPKSPTPTANLAHSATPPVAAPSPAPKKSFANTLADFFNGPHAAASESGEWGNRFLTETRDLASRGIGYDQSWRPDGESHSWAMDCSNTTRYLYQVTAGIQLPRTASDQYYYLHLQNKAWDVPTVSSGFADCNFLRSNLKPGDLLFWENTYRPDRQPPITHVMIFLGTNEKGQWIMAGSQSSHGGQFNPHRSGPDVYVFNPTRPTGGYTTWLGLVHHQGRFCAYGRPLEADVKKLSVAAND